MPWSALPEHINDPEEWEGTDWDNRWQRWMLQIKGWFAYGPRAKEWWAKWRPVPKDLININATRKETVSSLEGDTVTIYKYTSVIQYWSRWHLLIQWPLHVSFHVFWRKKTVPKKPETRDFKIWEMIYIRFGARFDNDQVYWFPSFFIGGDFN